MLKNKQKVAINRNGGIALDRRNKLARHTHVAKRLATRRTKMSLKDLVRAGVVNKGQYTNLRRVVANGVGNLSNGESQYVKRWLANTSMEEPNLSLQGRAITILSDRDWEQLMDSIDNPRGPSPDLIKLCQKYA